MAEPLVALQATMPDVLGRIGQSEDIRSRIIANRMAELSLEKERDLWSELQKNSGTTPGITPIETPRGGIAPPTPGLAPVAQGAAPTPGISPMRVQVPTNDPFNDPRKVDVGELPAGAPTSFADRFGAATPSALPGTTTGGPGPTIAPPQAAGLMRHPAQMQQLIAVRQGLGAAEKQEFDFKMERMGAEARGLLPYVETPEFPQRWNESVLRLRQQGAIDDQRFKLWYNNPSPLALQQALALSSSMDAYLKLEGIRTTARAAENLGDIIGGRKSPTTPTLAPRSTLAGPQPEIDAAIDTASKATGVPADYLRERQQMETGGEKDPATAKSTKSSAEGLFQFIDQAWLEQVKKNGAKYGFGDEANAIEKKGGNWVVTEPQMQQRIMAMRRIPLINATMAGEFTKENAEYLKNAGLPVTKENLHLAHFLGPRGAMEFLTAMQEDPSRAATSVVSRDAYRDNPDVFIEPNTNRPRTLEEVYRRIGTPASGRAPGEPLRVGQSPGQSQPTPPAPGAEVSGTSAPASAKAFGVLAPSLQGTPGIGPSGVSPQELLPALIKLQGSPNLAPGMAKTVEQLITWATTEAASTPAMKDYNQYVNYEHSMGRTPLGPLEKQVELENARGRAAALEHGAGQGNKPGLAKAQTDIAEVYGAYQKLAIDAGKKSQIYDEMDQALQGFNPGATADIRYKAQAILKDMGVPVGEGVPDYEVFKNIQKRLELVQTPKGQGSFSDNERALVRDTVASTNLTREGILRVLQMMRKLDAYDGKIAEVLRKDAQASGGAPDPVTGYEAVQKIAPPLDKGDLNYLATVRKDSRPPIEARSSGLIRDVTVERGRDGFFLYKGGDSTKDDAWNKVPEDKIEEYEPGKWRMKK